MKWESIMQQLHSGLHIFHSQYSPAEPRLATVDVDFACYKQKEMQIKGNFPFSFGLVNHNLTFNRKYYIMAWYTWLTLHNNKSPNRKKLEMGTICFR